MLEKHYELCTKKMLYLAPLPTKLAECFWQPSLIPALLIPRLPPPSGGKIYIRYMLHEEFRYMLHSLPFCSDDANRMIMQIVSKLSLTNSSPLQPSRQKEVQGAEATTRRPNIFVPFQELPTFVLTPRRVLVEFGDFRL